MAVKSTPVVTNDLTRTFIQDDGVGTVFNLYDCQSLPDWTRAKGAAVRVKVKSPDEYGKSRVKATARGKWEDPTFTVNAYTPAELDWLLDVDCPVDFWLVMGGCDSPSNLAKYTKIRHFYRSEPTSQGETGADYLGEEEAAGIQTGTAWTAEDMVTIVQVDTEEQRNGVTETQAFNDIAFLAEGRCEGDCGARIEEGQWGVAVAVSDYGSLTAYVWYTHDSGATWELCAFDPFADNDADISSCVILPGEVAPRIIVFRGNVDDFYAARASISDDWGASAWTEVDRGGNDNGSYINGAFKFAVGLIYTVGNGGYIYYSEDRGDSWTVITGVTTGVGVELWDIHLPPDKSSVIYAVGSGNTVITSDDSGESWADVTGPADGTEDLYAVDVDSKYRLYVGGEVDGSSECLWVTDDGGVTWTALTFTGSTLADGEVRRFRQCRRAPRQHKVFIHGADGADVLPDTDRRYGLGTSFRMFRTLDGGGSFERLDLVTNLGLNGLSIVDINHAWACGEVVGGFGEIQRYTPS
ncbi:MAG TPA: hypothetical protein VMY40_15325 [Anaerolineae bacterium]|nr:hypothetical protein [Anaerolineae bacterium]